MLQKVAVNRIPIWHTADIGGISRDTAVNGGIHGTCEILRGIGRAIRKWHKRACAA